MAPAAVSPGGETIPPGLERAPQAPEPRLRPPVSRTGTFGAGRIVTVGIEVERSLAGEADDFSKLVRRVLSDRRGWIEREPVAFRLSADPEPDLRITLAPPATVDRRCRPLETNGIFSCWNGRRVMINHWRWEHGAGSFENLRRYRLYLLNHEIGHALGRDHRDCPGEGRPAPVMMQQTKGVGACETNPWPARSPRGDTSSPS